MLTCLKKFPSMADGNLLQLETQDTDGTNRVYHYVNDIPLNASHSELLVNFIE